MEILRENLLNLIREKCTSTWELDVFEDHIIINVKEEKGDFRPVYISIKKNYAMRQARFPRAEC